MMKQGENEQNVTLGFDSISVKRLPEASPLYGAFFSFSFKILLLKSLLNV